MSRLTVSTDQVMVYDDFLPKEVFEPLLAYANSDSYAWIHKEGWHKAWHLGDGLPLIGTTTFYRDDRTAFESFETSRYPTGTPLDPFIEALSAAVAGAEALVGKRDSAWNGICVTPFIHPRGCGLSLHRDRNAYTGSFTYYIHHRWNLHWGGNLLILDPRTGQGVDLDQPRLYSFLSDDDESQLVCDPGLALCVLPKPNRLLFLRENAYHMVTRVDDNAGDRPRVTLSGFFLARSR